MGTFLVKLSSTQPTNYYFVVMTNNLFRVPLALILLSIKLFLYIHAWMLKELNWRKKYTFERPCIYIYMLNLDDEIS